MLPQSIRGRLLLWFTLLLACILGGFGVTAFHFNRSSELSRIDDALQQRVALLQSDFRRPGGGPGGFPERGRGGSGEGTGFGRPEGLPAFEGKRPPPKFSEKSDADDERGAPDRKGPPDGPRFFKPGPRVLILSSESARLFNEHDPASYYFAAWTSHGVLSTKSKNAPAEIPIPEGEATGRSYERTRGVLREMYHITERSDIVLVGRSIERSLAASRRFAWLMVAAGLVVLSTGVGGGWFIIGRSLQPVHDIGATARRIAGGDLSERINVPNSKSELGSLAAVLNSTFARLEASFSEQKNFTADASHELRTPLAVILTETQRILTRERSGAEYRATIETCRDAAQDMRKLTESLLELARLDAGQELMKKSACDLSLIASAACELIRPLAGQRQLRIITDCQPAALNGDSNRLQQLVLNLLQNAVRYNREGGEIRLSTMSDETHAVLAVADNGMGIGAEDIPHLFKRFYRADKARSRAHGGVGLGLSICKSIVDTHGGTIHVDSTPGVGTIFTVRIPH
jgi:two-component system, OmpR family, sensor kinase